MYKLRHYSQWLNSAGTGWNGVPQPVSGVPSPEIAVPLPQVVAPPSGFILMVHTVFFGLLIFGKIIAIVATSQVRFYRLNAPNSISAGARPQIPPGELTALPPQGPTSKRREGKGRKGNGGRKFHHLLLSNLTTTYRLYNSSLLSHKP